MKIAVVVTGFTRTFSYVKDNFLATWGNDVDYFFNLYDKTNNCNCETDVDLELFKEFEPKVLTMIQTANDNRFGNLVSFYKQHILPENYHVVVLARPDIYYHSKPTLDDINSEKIYNSNITRGNNGWPCDICYYGNKANIDKIIGEFEKVAGGPKGLRSIKACPLFEKMYNSVKCPHSLLKNAVENSNLAFVQTFTAEIVRPLCWFNGHTVHPRWDSFRNLIKELELTENHD